MPLRIGRGRLLGGGRFRIQNNAGQDLFDRQITSSFQKEVDPDTPFFVAGEDSNPGWISWTSGTWHKVSAYYTATAVNNGSHYSTSNTRFTAPKTGPYYFTHTTYFYTGNYIHPQFYVNGSASSRRAGTPYRIRNHGYVANYQGDMSMEEIIYLTAGDYVEVYSYGSGTSYHYPYYGCWQGIWIG